MTFFGRRYSTGAGFALGSAFNASVYLPVAVGEEAFFRGTLQAGLSETSLGLWGAVLKYLGGDTWKALGRRWRRRGLPAPALQKALPAPVEAEQA